MEYNTGMKWFHKQLTTRKFPMQDQKRFAIFVQKMHARREREILR